MNLLFPALAALIHIYIFCLESCLWGKPNTNRTFGVTPEVAEYNRLFAFNQGFYNLFLAAGAIAGLWIGTDQIVGRTLVLYTLFSMLLAALVLVLSQRRLWRAALFQGLAPLLGLATLLFR